VDGTLPNLALMKLAAFERERGNVPVLQRVPDEMTRYASVIFTKNRSRVEFWQRTYGFQAGGSGWDLTTNLPDEIEQMRPDYALYGVDYAMGYLSRGCIRNCSFCLVPKKEGYLRQVASIDDLVRPDCEKLMLLDNNLTALPNAIDVLGELADRKLKVCFTQGLDIRLITPGIAQALAKVAYRSTNWTRKQLYFAFDDIKSEKAVRRGIGILLGAGIDPDTLAFYVLVGFDSTFAEDVERCEILRSYGVRPYVMRYRKTPKLNALARWANAAEGMWRKMPFEKYSRKKRLKLTDCPRLF